MQGFHGFLVHMTSRFHNPTPLLAFLQVQYHLRYLIEFTINRCIYFIHLMFNKVNVVSIFIDRPAKLKTGSLSMAKKCNGEPQRRSAGHEGLKASPESYGCRIRKKFSGF